MLFILEMLLISGFTLCVCFYLGKRWGARKFHKIHEDMKAYETSFNQLIEQMELVSGHNLKVLETKTEELRELMPIVDKKLLYANDLMTELESLKRDIGTRLNPMAKSDQPVDLKFRREMHEALADIGNRLKSLETRMDSLEKTFLDMEMDRLAEQEKAKAAEAPKLAAVNSMPRPVKNEKIVSIKDEPLATSAPTGPGTADVVTFKPKGKLPEERPHQRAAPSVLETPSLREIRNLNPNVPKPGTILYQVLELHEQGVTLPQIARQLKIDHGEVEVIMNIYKPSMRKVT